MIAADLLGLWQQQQQQKLSGWFKFFCLSAKMGGGGSKKIGKKEILIIGLDNAGKVRKKKKQGKQKLKANGDFSFGAKIVSLAPDLNQTVITASTNYQIANAVNK